MLLWLTENFVSWWKRCWSDHGGPSLKAWSFDGGELNWQMFKICWNYLRFLLSLSKYSTHLPHWCTSLAPGFNGINESSVIIHSPSYHSKPLWFSFFWKIFCKWFEKMLCDALFYSVLHSQNKRYKCCLWGNTWLLPSDSFCTFFFLWECFYTLLTIVITVHYAQLQATNPNQTLILTPTLCTCC